MATIEAFVRRSARGARRAAAERAGPSRLPSHAPTPPAAPLDCRYLASAHIVDEDGEATRALLGARAARASAMAAAGG
jgi:hypothetical protein